MSTTTTPQTQPLPPPLHTLIKPAHILSLFRHHHQRKTHHFDGCIQLWSRILVRPPQSREYQQAYQGLVALTATIKDALARQREEAERERRQQQRQREGEQQEQIALSSRGSNREQDAFRTLIQQISTAKRDAVPSIAGFEAGLSAFQYPNSDAAIQAVLEHQDATLARDDVETALALLNVHVGVEERVGMEDLYAGLTLLGLRTSVRVDEFLMEMEKGGR